MENKIVLVAIAAILFSGPAVWAKSYSLNLSAAEKMAVDKSWGRKASEKEIDITRYKIKEKIGSLLPSLIYSQNLRYGNITAKESDPLVNNYSIGLRQEVPNPLKWSKENDVIHISNSIANKRKKKEIQAVIRSLREKYFQVENLQQKLANSKENLKLIKGLQDSAT